jgi:hypothetical protein
MNGQKLLIYFPISPSGAIPVLTCYIYDHRVVSTYAVTRPEVRGVAAQVDKF